MEEVQHPHHQQDLEPEVLEIHLLQTLHKVKMVVEDITKLVFILQVVVAVEQQLLVLQVEIVEVQHPQEMVELVQQILLQDRQLVEQVEEMVKVVVAQHLVQVNVEAHNKIQQEQQTLVEAAVVVLVEMVALV